MSASVQPPPPLSALPVDPADPPPLRVVNGTVLAGTVLAELGLSLGLPILRAMLDLSYAFAWQLAQGLLASSDMLLTLANTLLEFFVLIVFPLLPVLFGLGLLVALRESGEKPPPLRVRTRDEMAAELLGQEAGYALVASLEDPRGRRRAWGEQSKKGTQFRRYLARGTAKRTRRLERILLVKLNGIALGFEDHALHPAVYVESVRAYLCYPPLPREMWGRGRRGVYACVKEI